MENFEITPEQHIKAAYDSVSLIDSILAEGVFNDKTLDTLKRNYQHLEIISGKDYAVDFTDDVAAFAVAIAAAKAVQPVTE